MSFILVLCIISILMLFRQMKTFEESMKSQKTVASMIENKKEDPKSNKKKGKGGEELEPKGMFKNNIYLLHTTQHSGINQTVCLAIIQ